MGAAWLVTLTHSSACPSELLEHPAATGSSWRPAILSSARVSKEGGRSPRGCRVPRAGSGRGPLQGHCPTELLQVH